MKSDSTRLQFPSSILNLDVDNAPAEKKQRQLQQPQSPALIQDQCPAVPLDVPAAATLVEQETSITQGRPGLTTVPASVKQLLSQVGTLDKLEAAFKLLDDSSIHPLTGELSGALAALCMRLAFPHPDVLCRMLRQLLMPSHVHEQHLAALEAILAGANNLPLPALRAVVLLLQETHKSTEAWPDKTEEKFDVLFSSYLQRQAMEGAVSPLSESTDASAALLNQPLEFGDPRVLDATESNGPACPGVQSSLLHQVQQPFSDALPKLLCSDVGGLIIGWIKPDLELLPPQTGVSLAKSQEILGTMWLVNKQICSRMKGQWYPEWAALAWCFKLNSFERTPWAGLMGLVNLRQALVKLISPDPQTAVVLENWPNALQVRIDILIRRLTSSMPLDVEMSLVDQLFGELAQLGDSKRKSECEFVDLKHFVRLVILAALRRPHHRRDAIVQHVCNALNSSKAVPPEQFAECLVELCIAYHDYPQTFPAMKAKLESLAGEHPAVKPLEARLDRVLSFLRAPAMASEELMATMLEYLSTAVFWTLSEFSVLLKLADRAEGAPLPQPLQGALEDAVAAFILHTCWLDKNRVHPDGVFFIGPAFSLTEIALIRKLPIGLLVRVFPRLDVRVKLMLTMQKHQFDPRWLPLLSALAEDERLPREDRLIVVKHWLQPFADDPGNQFRKQLDSMVEALTT